LEWDQEGEQIVVRRSARYTSADVHRAVFAKDQPKRRTLEELKAGKFRSRPAVGFSDCLLLEIARRAGDLPLGTFDRNLGKPDGAERLST
jgi:predicted nucleic acid-binding protein